MKPRFIIILIFTGLALFPACLNAQRSLFTNVYYDLSGNVQGYGVCQTYDNNYIIAGEKDVSPLVIKTDGSGNIIWSKTMGSVVGERFLSVIPTFDSCFLLLGRTFSILQSQYQVLCIKINSQGDTLWTRAYQMGVSALPQSVQMTSDHGFIIAANVGDFGAPSAKMAVLKTDANGQLLWSKMISTGSEGSYAYSVRQTTDNGYILCGTVVNTAPYYPSATLIKLTNAGEVTWAKKISHPAQQYVSGVDVVPTTSGFIAYTTGYEGINIIMTDLSGNIISTNRFIAFQPAIYDDLPRPKLHSTPDGGYIFTAPGWGFDPLIKIDSSGNYQWAQMIAIITSDVILTHDHGYAIIGNGPILGVSMAPTDRPQTGLIKTDSLGNSGGCVNPLIVDTDTVSLISTTLSCSVTPGGALTSTHPVITDINLSTFQGCVAITGSANDKVTDIASLQIQPNPSRGVFSITFNQPVGNSISAVTIYDAFGQLVYQTHVAGLKCFQVDLNSKPAGLYFIRVQTGAGSVSRRIMINH